MATTRVSTKGQIVLPAEIREKMGLQPGDELTVEVVDGKAVVAKAPKSWAQWGYGLGKEIWEGVDVDEYVRKERETWEDPERESD